jgi:hypothetical protein
MTQTRSPGTGHNPSTMTREQLENHVLSLTDCLIDVMRQAGRSSNPMSTAMYRAKKALYAQGINYKD